LATATQFHVSDIEKKRKILSISETFNQNAPLKKLEINHMS